MAQIPPIKCGERYVRPEDPETVWIIDRLVELPGLPTHGRLISEKRRNKTMTLSEVALRDGKLYRQLEELLGEAPEPEEQQMEAA